MEKFDKRKKVLDETTFEFVFRDFFPKCRIFFEKQVQIWVNFCVVVGWNALWGGIYLSLYRS